MLKSTALEVRGTLLADDCILSIAVLDDVFSIILVPLDSLEGRWSFDGSTDEQKVVPSKDLMTILPLPVPFSQDREPPREDNPLDATQDWTPYLLGHRVFTPHWRPNSPTEVLIAASHVDQWTDMQLLSYHLQVTRRHVPAFLSHTKRAHTKHSLSLISTVCVPSPELPWNPSSLSNTGHMFSLDSQLRCFSLFVDTGDQPINEISLGMEFSFTRNSFHPVLSAVDPWSGHIAVKLAGQVKVLYFD